MQIGLFKHLTNYQQVEELVRTIVEFNNNSHILISGLVPRPMDHEQSRKNCKEMDSSYRLVAQELRCKYDWNVGFRGVFLEFLQLDGKIKDPKNNFVQDIFLSTKGVRMLCAIWLRHLGFFPVKAADMPGALLD